MKPLFRFQINSLPYVHDKGPPRPRSYPQVSDDLHLVHTLRGHGMLYVGDDCYEASPEVVIAVPMNIRCEWAKCDHRVWEMQNIHYTVDSEGNTPLESHHALPVSFTPRDLPAMHKQLRAACRQWRKGDTLQQMEAAAKLQAMIAGYWRAFGKPGVQSIKRDAAVERAAALLTEHADQPFDADWLAGEVGLSVSQMNRRFRAARGLSPQRYWQDMRLVLCKRALGESDATLESLAPALGFSDVYYFCRWFRKQTGKTPGQFRRKSRPTIY